MAQFFISNETKRLRELAERKLSEQSMRDVPDLGDTLSQRLVHELQVHQIELEMQNEELKLEQTRLKLAASVFNNTYEGIIITDANKLMLEVNPAFSRITGYSPHEAIGRNPKMLACVKENARIYTEMKAALHAQGCWRGELLNQHKSGEAYQITLSVTAIHDEVGKLINYVGVFTDISVLKRHEAELDRIAHYDPLTGTPNRRLLADRLNQAIAHAQRSRLAMAVCYLDLDGFKQINDQHGHAMGDEVLIEITRRLLAILRPDDTLARLGGDEFVILLTDLPQQDECQMILSRILAAVCTPMQLNKHQLNLSASIGATLFPSDPHEPDLLIRHADQAMYAAKKAGKNRIHFYSPAEDLLLVQRNQNIERLRSALSDQEFVLHYQPKVDLLSGEIIGLEALLRWEHPQLGLLTPSLFLADINGSPLEVPVGEWVIETVLKQMSAWQTAGLHVKVSLNIGAAHLFQPDFYDQLNRLLSSYPKINPAHLELEILETTAINDFAMASEAMARCHQLGVRFALDDFGTGYSSLAYLRRLPIDMLKIDQSFIRDILTNASDLGIVEGVILMAAVLKHPVLAEGVETLKHGALLVQIGCHLCQGDGIAQPMPAEQIPAWITQWHAEEIWHTLGKMMLDETNSEVIVENK
ncbi:EAL domain-containing protein [Chitinibacter bivalviorum]|uniref:EAL domain-containing protein n=1 Tax=Chitinibacter bivalviorum TaxID=2739434 RepID=A0A7H9BLM7_9NEIS|nr:EAL domain-containing protein [Chitinibacter bivalviorum]QLG89349.1 EAL domain-containing protein [Chitinibacter bivalviorum]